MEILRERAICLCKHFSLSTIQLHILKLESNTGLHSRRRNEMEFNTLRHDSVLDWRTFTQPIHVVGVGGIGGSVVELLLRYGLGVRNEIHVWDDDIVEAHNTPNQVYLPSHVGRP